jgi:hypothetical protein
MQRTWVGAFRGVFGRGVVGGVLLMLTGGLGVAFGSGGQPASAVARKSVVVILRDQFRSTPDSPKHVAGPVGGRRRRAGETAALRHRRRGDRHASLPAARCVRGHRRPR